ncbi:MAG: ABC transporter permease [Cyclobacteriaceae bacterium]
MINYCIKKSVFGVSILLGVVTLLFFLFQVLPGDPVSMMMGQRSDIATRQSIEKELGLDQPLINRYFYYLNDISPLSFHKNTEANEVKYNYTKVISGASTAFVIKAPYLGRSYQSDRLVSKIIPEYAAGSLWLALVSIAFASVVGIALGVVSAWNKNSWADRLAIFLSTLGISAPSFVTGIFISILLGGVLAAYTGLSMTGSLWEIDAIRGKHLEVKNIILPALTLGIRPLAIITQLTRSAVLDVLNQDYIRTAKAKGLSNFQVVYNHVLKNALNPVITAVSGWLASLLAGSFFVEFIFSWKGLGIVTIQSVMKLDYPVVIGTALFIALIFVVITLAVDILYAIVDPRIRYE